MATKSGTKALVAAGFESDLARILARAEIKDEQRKAEQPRM
jgi:hypothetical protein